MNEPSKGNFWFDRNIPALEYCRLPRAAELLGCNISDLLHWAEIEAIELCLKIDSMPVYVDFDSPEISKWFNEQLQNESITLIPRVKFSEKSIFQLCVSMADPENSDLKYHLSGGDIGYNIQRNKDGAVLGYAEGLWNFFVSGLNDEFYFELLNRECITIDFFDLGISAADKDSEPVAYLRPCDFKENNFFGGIDYNDDLNSQEVLPRFITITINDLFITREQIEFIHSNKGCVLTSIITGKAKRHQSVQIGHSTFNEEHKRKRRAPKKEALIKALMNNHGIDSEKPLSTLLILLGISEGKLRSYSEAQLHRTISQVLDGRIPHIDPKTLARWLKEEGAR